MSAITYYLPSGEIDSILSGDDSVIDETIKISTLEWVEGVWDGATHYIFEGEAIERPINTATLDGLTLQNLPLPCKIVINGTEYECSDPDAELDLPILNEYLITVVAFPYLDAEFEIET